MRCSFAAQVGVIACALSAGSCNGASGAARPLPSAPGRSTSSAQSTAASGQCPVRVCRSIHRVDVDGDGRSDVITVSVARRSRRGVYFRGDYSVEVALATGVRLLRSLHATGWPTFGPHHGDLWQGALQLDQRGGDELLLGDQTGANYVEFHVLHIVNGQLVTLRAPTGTWYQHASAGAGAHAYSCRAGSLAFSSAVPVSHHLPLRIREVDQRFSWNGTDWRKTYERGYVIHSWKQAGALRPWQGCTGETPPDW